MMSMLLTYKKKLSIKSVKKGINKMKRKFCLVLSIVLSITMLTGCASPLSNLPFGKKDNQQNSTPVDDLDFGFDDEFGDFDSVEYVDLSAEYQIGDTIVASESVSVDPDKIVEQILFMDEVGAVTDSITFKGAGDFSYSVIVEYDDGTSWDSEFSVSVVAPEINLPDAIASTLSRDTWSTGKLGEAWELPDISLKMYSKSSNNVVLSDALEYSYGSGSISTYTNAEKDINLTGFKFDNNVWLTLSYLPTEIEAALNSMDTHYLKNAITKLYINQAKEQIDNLAEVDSITITDDTNVYINSILDYLKQFVDNNVSVKTVNTDYVLYDVQGNQYPIKRVIVSFNYAAVGGSQVDYTQMWYADIPDNGRLIIRAIENPTDGQEPTYATDIGTAYYDWLIVGYQPILYILNGFDPSTGAVTNAAPASYDAFVGELHEWLTRGTMEKTITPMIEDVKNFDAESNKVISSIQNNFLIGNVNVILGEPEDDEVVSIDPVINEPEDEPTESEEVVEVRPETPTYRSLYPEYYTWPEDTNTYYRWVWNPDLENTTVDLGYAIDENGQIILMHNYDQERDYVFDNDDSQIGQSGQKYFLLQEANIVYKITEVEDSVLKIKTSASTNERVAIQNDETKMTYYVSFSSMPNVINATQYCLYPTTGFLDGLWTATSNSTVTVETGSFVYYNINYTDTQRVAQTKGYMGYITLSNIDSNSICLFIYADGPCDSNDLIAIARDMVKVN